MDLKKIREDLKDPKKKAKVQLMFYAIFFLFVFILLALGKPYDTKDYKSYIDDKKDEDVAINDYSYKYEIIDNESIINVEGTSSDDTFTYNGEEYYTISGKTYKSFNKEADFYFDPSIYSYEKIEELLEKYTFEEKVVHKDLTETTSYKINAGDYLDSSIETCSSVVNMIVEKKEYINKVSIDLSNCYNYNYIINIEYNSID